MSDSDEYLPSENSMESCDTSHSSSRGGMEVPSMAQPYWYVDNFDKSLLLSLSFTMEGSLLSNRS